MKKFIVLIPLFLLTACSSQTIQDYEGIGHYHDDKNHVTCWTLSHGNSTAISCIPDKQLK